MQDGKLAPDSLVIGLIRDRIREPDSKPGFILDGFPRTVTQAEALDQMLTELNRTVDLAILFQVPDQALIQRLSGRRTCLNCGAMFHTETLRPKNEGTCDTCQSPLVQREDDHEGVIQKRLKIYHEATEPLVEYYNKNGKLKIINASLETSQVNALVEKTLAASAQ